VTCHSERSEESLFLPSTVQEGFLASLGMTELVHFPVSCKQVNTRLGPGAISLLDLSFPHKIFSGSLSCKNNP